MKGRLSPMSEVNLFASLADLKEIDYHNTLLLTALVDVLMEKGVLTSKDLTEKVRTLDTLSTSG